MPKLFVPDHLPEWFRVIKPDALLRSKEVAELFGYSNANNVTSAALRGQFPKADAIAGEMPITHHLHSSSMYRGARKSVRKYWRKSTILAEIKRRKAINEEK